MSNEKAEYDPLAMKLFKHHAKRMVKGFQIKQLPPTEEWVKSKADTYTSFSGADTLVKINDKPAGAVSGIKWNAYTEIKSSGNSTIRGTITSTLFSDLNTARLIKDGPENIIEVYMANEYGGKYRMVFKEVEFFRRAMDISMDDIMFEETFEFICKYMEESVPE